MGGGRKGGVEEGGEVVDSLRKRGEKSVEW